MMGESFVDIDRFENGFTVRIKDPAIVKKNDARDKAKANAPYVPWVDPWKSFVFKTDKEVIAFLGKNLSKAIVSAKPASDYEGSFDLACADTDGD